MKHVYVAAKLGLSFMCPKLDKNGDAVRKDKEGRILYKGDRGWEFAIDESERHNFQTTERDINKGFQCRYLVDNDTPLNIALRLEELAKNPSSAVMTLKEWTKQTDPKRALAEDKAEILEKENNELKKKFDKMNEELERLKKKG